MVEYLPLFEWVNAAETAEKAEKAAADKAGQAADEATIEQLLRDTADPLPIGPGEWQGPRAGPPANGGGGGGKGEGKGGEYNPPLTEPAVPEPAVVWIPGKFGDKRCRYGNNCKYKGCNYAHPTTWQHVQLPKPPPPPPPPPPPSPLRLGKDAFLNKLEKAEERDTDRASRTALGTLVQGNGGGGRGTRGGGSNRPITANSSQVFQTELLVAESEVGRLIGKKGSKIKQLRKESGAELELLEPAESQKLGLSTDFTKRVLRITAPDRATLERACELVRKSVTATNAPIAPDPNQKRTIYVAIDGMNVGRHHSTFDPEYVDETNPKRKAFDEVRARAKETSPPLLALGVIEAIKTVLMATESKEARAAGVEYMPMAFLIEWVRDGGKKGALKAFNAELLDAWKSYITYTPPGHNDDDALIGFSNRKLGQGHECYLVTNDLFKDHIYQGKITKEWFKQHVVGYMWNGLGGELQLLPKQNVVLPGLDSGMCA